MIIIGYCPVTEGPSSSWILVLDDDETDNQYPILMHDKSRCIVPNTRISSPSTVVSAAVVIVAAVVTAGSEEDEVSLDSVFWFFLLLWTFQDPPPMMATVEFSRSR